MAATIQIQYSYFYLNAKQIYLYLGLRNGIKIAKIKCCEIYIDYFGT